MVADAKNLRKLLVAALGTIALVAATPAHAALRAPTPLEPAAGATVEAMPAFAWSAVAGAASYEFQLAADQNFNAPVLGRGEGQFSTRNTRATVKKTVPNGTYWWRVRVRDAGRRDVTVVGAALPPQELDRRTQHSGARARIPLCLPELPDAAQLVASPVRDKLSLLPRQ